LLAATGKKKAENSVGRFKQNLGKWVNKQTCNLRPGLKAIEEAKWSWG
jgi:hypothetical protein